VEELLFGAVIEAIKLSPAVVILFWAAWRADARAEACFHKLIEHLGREH